MQLDVKVDSVPQVNNMLESEDGWESYWVNMFNKIEENKQNDQKLRDKMDHDKRDNIIDPESFGGEDFPPICSPEDEAYIKELYATNPKLQNIPVDVANRGYDKQNGYLTGSHRFNPDAWIQTYSGRRFNPTNPVPDAIVIQDIAHPLSNQCRFSGHCNKFYSVAQHCVLVSYICNFEDALWGLLHDATEAYLVDVPRPLKQSGLFGAYIEFETKMTAAVCERFGLNPVEPPSVKQADKVLLSTEARDLMNPLRPDWDATKDALPFKIEPWSPEEAKERFLKRFFELNGTPEQFDNLSKYVK